MPNTLRGLSVNDFAHPEDNAAVNSLMKIRAIDKLMSAIEEKSNQIFIRMVTLGNCVRLTEQNDPKTFSAVRKVCDVLDYESLPEIYTHRNYEIDVEPNGVDKPVLIIPDFVVNNFDTNLLYFTIGRAVTRLKSGYLKFFIAAKLMLLTTDSIPFLSDAVKLALANWLRKSELTADRGGLLACQSFQTAVRFLLCKAGMPIKETKTVKIHDYIDEYKIDGGLAKMGKNVQTLTNCAGWANDRILELFLWNAQGNYGDILDKYLD